MAARSVWSWWARHPDVTLTSRPDHSSLDRAVEAALLSSLTPAPMLEVSSNRGSGDERSAAEADALGRGHIWGELTSVKPVENVR
jgi:hypothetical protein